MQCLQRICVSLLGVFFTNGGNICKMQNAFVLRLAHNGLVFVVMCAVEVDNYREEDRRGPADIPDGWALLFAIALYST